MSIELVCVAAAEQFQLAPGNHATREEGLCAMEAVAWLAGLPHSDKPACTSEILGGYVRHLNDNMPDEERARLVPYLPHLIGTADPNLDHVLNNYLAWQAIHIFAPMALRTEDYAEEAGLLEEQHSLSEAQAAAKAMLRYWHLSDDPGPVPCAVVRAHSAAMLARFFYSQRGDWTKGVWFDTYDACARATAGAAFQAYRAGCADAWDNALVVLEDALEIVTA